MSDLIQPPTASVRSRADKRRRLSLIWAIPLVTALIAAWLVWDTYSKRGPLITITFDTAEGLQADQSHVKHKDVDMGVVQSAVLTPDLQHVLVTVRMNKAAEPLLTDRTQFWVVKPRFFAGNISGLSTLFSGSYIELLPAAEGGKEERHFTGLENPPVLQSNVPGRTFVLKANRIGSINLGSPIFYRDLPVGEVLGWDLGDMAATVTVHAFVRKPFDQYVHDDSRFWNASGVSVKLGADGVQLQLESLRALLLGGIAFENSGRCARLGRECRESGVPALREQGGCRSSFLPAPRSLSRVLQRIGERTWFGVTSHLPGSAGRRSDQREPGIRCPYRFSPGARPVRDRTRAHRGHALGGGPRSGREYPYAGAAWIEGAAAKRKPAHRPDDGRVDHGPECAASGAANGGGRHRASDGPRPVRRIDGFSQSAAREARQHAVRADRREI